MAESIPIPTNPRFQDLTGRSFGRFTVLSFLRFCGSASVWRCRCDCGQECELNRQSLIRKRVALFCFFCRRHCVSLEELFWMHVEKRAQCWVWVGKSFETDGYGKLDYSGREGRKMYRVHRLSYELNCGPIPDGLCVCHDCDNPPCVRPDHLFLATAEGNFADMFRKGRHVSGERHPNARLTAEQIAIMKKKREETGASYATIGREYGVTWAAARDAILGTRWAHLK